MGDIARDSVKDVYRRVVALASCDGVIQASIKGRLLMDRNNAKRTSHCHEKTAAAVLRQFQNTVILKKDRKLDVVVSSMASYYCMCARSFRMCGF